MSDPFLSLKGVSKRYGATLALDEVNFACRGGEVHAVLGENGAGKSTLMKVMAGVVQPSGGEIVLDGARVQISSPAEALRRGIVCMFQELSLVPDLSVRENLMLGAPGTGLGRLRRGLVDRARDILERIDGGGIRLRAKVADLSLAERQQVEIAKALTRDPRLLILDEATSALNAAVVEKVFDLIRTERDRGVGILFISHRFHEVEALADTISVFRNGRNVATFPKGAHDYGEIIGMMVGRRIEDLFPPKPARAERGEEVLRLQDFSWGDAVSGITLSLRSGQILGLGGLEGQGQALLLHRLFGLLKGTGGALEIGGREAQVAHPAEAKAPENGIALVPEDRKTEGLVLDLSIRRNLELAALGVPGLAAEDIALYRRFIEALELKYDNLDQPVAQLSGGNQQKVALAKWLALGPRVLCLADPTRGIDVKTKTQIYTLLRRLADDGVAVLLLSTDYEELVHLCDEVHVFYGGRVARRLAGADITAENIVAASLDLTAPEAAHA